MIKPLTIDLALPLYAELPNHERSAADTASDSESATLGNAYGGNLELGLERELGDETPQLFVYG